MASAHSQPDLFAPPPEAPRERSPEEVDYARLVLSRIMVPFLAAERLPCDYTAATVAEIRVMGLCDVLPEPEASETRQLFNDTLDRLYALEPQPSEEAAGN